MAGSIAELLVKLGLDKAEFTTGLAKAVEEARDSSKRIKESFAGNLLAHPRRDHVRGCHVRRAWFPFRARGVPRNVLARTSE